MADKNNKDKNGFAKDPILSKLSMNAQVTLKVAYGVAKQLNGESDDDFQITPKDIFIAILLNPETLGMKVLMNLDLDPIQMLGSLGFDEPRKFISAVKKIVKGASDEAIDLLDMESKQVLSTSYQLANRYGHVYVGTEHIIMAILRLGDLEITNKLRDDGLTYEDFLNSLSEMANYPIGILAKPDESTNPINLSDEDDQEQVSFGMPGQQDKSSILSSVTEDLVKRAKRGKLEPVIGRDEEINKVINILSRSQKNNALVVGDSGVGKTALVEGLAQRIAEGSVPSSLSDFKIMQLDLPTLMATSKTRGDIESRMLVIIDAVVNTPNVILFLDEVQSILSGSTMPLSPDVSSVLKPALVKPGFRCIATTTTKDWTTYFQNEQGLMRRFQPVRLEESTKDETVEILKQIKNRLEKHHGVKISDEALSEAVKLSDRYVSDRFLPDKAIDLLDEATATKRLEVENKYHDLVDYKTELDKTVEKKEKAVKLGRFEAARDFKKKEATLSDKIKAIQKAQKKTQSTSEFIVDVPTIKTIVSEWTGIPVDTINERESGMLLELEETLEKSIVAQDEACEAVSRAIKRARAGISSPNRPWTSLLFLGPTGVGKTELAKVLTRELFGDEERLVQIDMSELMEPHSVSKLIGSPPGYIGYREGGQLTETIQKQPHSVVLFDEIEKAHTNVLNILLQILEDGHLTDARGNRVDFKNTIVLLTSNIGAEEISKDKVLGFSEKPQREKGSKSGRLGTGGRSDKEIREAYESMKDDLLDELKDSLRPELLNRLDDVIIFRSLTRKDAKKIVKLLVQDLNDRLEEQNIKIKLSRKAVNYIVKEGFSEEYGARPLRRVIQDEVEGLLADWVLEQKSEGVKFDEIAKVKIDREDGELIIDD